LGHDLKYEIQKSQYQLSVDIRLNLVHNEMSWPTWPNQSKAQASGLGFVMMLAKN
jgi:hypothetical protein